MAKQDPTGRQKTLIIELESLLDNAEAGIYGLDDNLNKAALVVDVDEMLAAVE